MAYDLVSHIINFIMRAQLEPGPQELYVVSGDFLPQQPAGCAVV